MYCCQSNLEEWNKNSFMIMSVDDYLVENPTKKQNPMAKAMNKTGLQNCAIVKSKR